MVAKSSECKTTARPSSSSNNKQFKGVRRRSWGKWVSEIRLPNTRARLWLGSYATAEQAARAFDVAVVCLRGRSATLNFPESPPAYAPLGLPHHQIQELAAAAAAAHTSLCSPTAEPGSDLAMPSVGTPSIPAAMSPETPDTAASEASPRTIPSQGASTPETSAMRGGSQELLSWDEELLLKCGWEEEPLWENSVFDYWTTACADLLPVDHYANDDMYATMADPHGLWSL